MTLAANDLRYISRALELARAGVGLVSPGALVGAVIVNHGRVVGEGYYQYDHKKHAEILAIEKAGSKARGGTLYLNLEPCSHFGRTPPCADRVVESGIRRVVCSMADPNPRIAGRGFRKLRTAGIAVEIGALKNAAAQLNEAFFKFIITKIPFVTLKVAMTLDGKIALAHQKKGSATRITSDASLRRVHEIRHDNDAVLVGVNTILMDDPLLTDRSRRPRRRPLLRVILDSRLRTPLHSRLVKTARHDVLILCRPQAPGEKKRRLEKTGVQVCACLSASSRKSWPRILKELGRREIQSLLIEGGANTSATAIEAEVIDKFCFFVAPKILGGREHLSAIGGHGASSLDRAVQVASMSVETIDGDLLITGYRAR